MTRLTISTKLFTSLTDVLALLLNKAFNTRWPNYLCGCWMSGRMIYLISLSDIERVWEVCHVLAEFHYHCCDLAHITFPGVESCFKWISCSLLIIRKWVSFLDFHNKLLQLLTLSPSYHLQYFDEINNRKEERHCVATFSQHCYAAIDKSFSDSATNLKASTMVNFW